ncbi:hypothetical protein GQ53DRAFT_775416 [Thozetella sp. PMI_491]|nr:hypothetical protein GQ53DRAFT_775416 [Thozetella sp. PMI_491]
MAVEFLLASHTPCSLLFPPVHCGGKPREIARAEGGILHANTKAPRAYDQCRATLIARFYFQAIIPVLPKRQGANSPAGGEAKSDCPPWQNKPGKSGSSGSSGAPPKRRRHSASPFGPSNQRQNTNDAVAQQNRTRFCYTRNLARGAVTKSMRQKAVGSIARSGTASAVVEQGLGSLCSRLPENVASQLVGTCIRSVRLSVNVGMTSLPHGPDSSYLGLPFGFTKNPARGTGLPSGVPD